MAEITANGVEQQSSTSDNKQWTRLLKRSKKGEIVKSMSNFRLIFSKDEYLNQIRFDSFRQNDFSFTPVFFNVNGDKIDDESAGKIQEHLEIHYDLFTNQNKIFQILKATSLERSYNPVKDFICEEKWDGTPRLATVLIDFLGANDTELIREQTKKWFVAAVARVFEPGCKFDNVLTIPGPEGIGKSTFFSVIGGKWFSDSFSFASSDKEKVESILNAWIIEISELNGMKRANDVEAAKAFLSRCCDSMRPAYGHKVIEFKRHNVFAATTNETNFLQGENGNRRWWVIPVNGAGEVSSWADKLKSIVHQLWAEAYYYYDKGEELFLPSHLEMQAREIQMNHSSILDDPILEEIRMYLERAVPLNYNRMSIPERLHYQRGGYANNDEPKTELNMVCAQQLIKEIPNDLIRYNSNKYNARYVNLLMSHVEGWTRSEQEKVKGLHPVYCDKTGRVKHPWVRISSIQPKEEDSERSVQQELPF